LAGVGIPQPHGSVVAAGGQPVPIRTKRHTIYPVDMARQRDAQGLVGVGIPQPHRAGGADGGQPVPIRASFGCAIVVMDAMVSPQRGAQRLLQLARSP
jgi:hypothetical protein